MLVAGMLVPNMGSWLLVCWCPALDSGCCFAVLQHGKLFASLLVPSMGFWLLVYWSPTWDKAIRIQNYILLFGHISKLATAPNCIFLPNLGI